jgi:negative regulator of flagellin synthesis FlgM
MVDPIGNKAGAVADPRIVPVRAAQKIAAAPRVANDLPELHSAATEMSAAMAAQPPVDTGRIARIRQAIHEGRFAAAPADIADRMLALKTEWESHGPA